MDIKTLYRYKRPDGGVTVSPEEPDVPYTVMYRLIADDGMMVTQDGRNGYSVVDTDAPDEWREVESDGAGVHDD